MTGVMALTVGFGLGLATYGGLWLTIRQVFHKPEVQAGEAIPFACASDLCAASSIARLALVAAAFYGMSREGPDKLLMGLGGLWLARWHLLHRLGDRPHEG